MPTHLCVKCEEGFFSNNLEDDDFISQVEHDVKPELFCHASSIVSLGFARKNFNSNFLAPHRRLCYASRRPGPTLPGRPGPPLVYTADSRTFYVSHRFTKAFHVLRLKGHCNLMQESANNIKGQPKNKGPEFRPWWRLTNKA